MKKTKKISIKARKKQKFLVWLTIIITAINFLLVLGFVIYLYFWVKAR